MKKVLTLFLVVCMLLSVIPMTVSAEVIKELSPTAPESLSTVVYVGSIEAEYTPDGTREKPYKNLKAAYDAAIQDKTEGDIKIVVLNDIFAVDETLGNKFGNYNLFFEQYTGGTVYICGEYNNDTESYPVIDFKNHLAEDKATLFSIGADTVFYDVVFDNSNGINKNLWVNAALYDLTMGRNISKGENIGTFAITGSCWSTDQQNNPDTRSDGAVVSIYSGTYSEIYAGPRSSTKTYTVNTDITLNIFGGTTTKIWGAANNTASYIKGKITINIHDVTFVDNGNQLKTLSAGTDNESATINLNLDYYYEIPSGLFAKNFTSVNRFGAKCVGVQNTDVVADNTYSVRFVGIVDSLDYEAVGFEIKTVESSFDFTTSCRYVYNSLLGIIDGETKAYTAAEFGGKYIYAVVIQGIPLTETVTFKVRSFVKQGGTTYYGKEDTVTYTNGEKVGEAKSFSVASLNLRNNDTNTTEKNYLNARMPRIINFINAEKPDSIGVQECDLGDAIGNMRETLDLGIKGSGYVCAQEEQRCGSQGEKFAFKNFIWYNSNTTECTESGQYWLSETPDQASTSFGTKYYISMGWARLKNKATGYEYVHVNTHLVVDNQAVRLQEIKILLEKVSALTDNGKLPVFLTGDMNSQPDSTEYKQLTETFLDTRYMTTNTTQNNTFTCFGTDKNPRIIDFCICAVDENTVGINRFQVVEKYDNGWLSDHSALLVDVQVIASVQQK